MSKSCQKNPAIKARTRKTGRNTLINLATVVLYNGLMKIAIIGGGAAGMMATATSERSEAAITAALAAGSSPKKNPKVFLIEKNKSLGQKVLISGGGRCNVTTGFSDLRLIADRYPRGGKFLLSSLHDFPPEAVIAWFETHGVPMKTEEDLRVFPKSDSGKDVLAAFEKIFQSPDVEVLLGHEVTRIEHSPEASLSISVAKRLNQQFQIHFKNQPPLTVDKLILTTGGQAHRHTGSTGDGYTFAESLGHTITPLAPSLNSFITQEKWPHALAGVSLPLVTLKIKTQKKFEYSGPILFTHRGLTGPAIFALSSYIAFETYDPQHPLTLTVDLFPNWPHTKLEQELQREMKENPKKLFRNTLALHLPKSLALELCSQFSIAPEKINIELSKKDFIKTLEKLKNLPFTLIGRAAGDEFVTAGGVELSEVDPKTLESKICPGLYFAGEILNIDGFTGGYNLQAAWCTGRRAGECASID